MLTQALYKQNKQAVDDINSIIRDSLIIMESPNVTGAVRSEVQKLHQDAIRTVKKKAADSNEEVYITANADIMNVHSIDLHALHPDSAAIKVVNYLEGVHSNEPSMMYITIICGKGSHSAPNNKRVFVRIKETFAEKNIAYREDDENGNLFVQMMSTYAYNGMP